MLRAHGNNGMAFTAVVTGLADYLQEPIVALPRLPGLAGPRQGLLF